MAAELGGAVRRRHVEAHFEEGRRVAPRAAAEVEDGGSRREQRSEALPHGGELNVARRVCKLVGMRRAVGEGLVGRCRHGGPLTQAVRLGVYPIAKRAFSARTVLRRTHDSGALGQANTPDNAFRSRVRLYAGVWCENRSIPGSKSHRTPPSSSVSALLADIWCAEGSRALHGCESRPPLCVSKSRADPALSASRGAVMLVAEAAGGEARSTRHQGVSDNRSRNRHHDDLRDDYPEPLVRANWRRPARPRDCGDLHYLLGARRLRYGAAPASGVGAHERVSHRVCDDSHWANRSHAHVVRRACTEGVRETWARRVRHDFRITRGVLHAWPKKICKVFVELYLKRRSTLPNHRLLVLRALPCSRETGSIWDTREHAWSSCLLSLCSVMASTVCPPNLRRRHGSGPF